MEYDNIIFTQVIPVHDDPTVKAIAIDKVGFTYLLTRVSESRSLTDDTVFYRWQLLKASGEIKLNL